MCLETSWWKYILDNSSMAIRHPIPLQCLYEAHTLESCKGLFDHKKVEFYKLMHAQYLSNYDMFALGYAICTCGKLWILGLTSSTESALEMFSHGLKSTKQCHGSITELHLDYSPGIINKGGHLLQLPHQILQNVTELSLAGSEIDQKGFENLASSIPKMPNLVSLDV